MLGILKRQILPSRRRIYQQDNVKPCCALITKARCRSKQSVCSWLLCWQSIRLFKSLPRHGEENETKVTTVGFAGQVFYSERGNRNSSRKTASIGVLNSPKNLKRNLKMEGLTGWTLYEMSSRYPYKLDWLMLMELCWAEEYFICRSSGN